MKFRDQNPVALTRQQCREIDRLAIEELGIPGVVLMENAGRGAADMVFNLIDEMTEADALKGNDARVAIVCGGGNNGGDGYVIARHLYNAGVEVAVFAVSDPRKLTGDAAVMADIVLNMGLAPVLMLDAKQVKEHAGELAEADIIVDAILGTGFTGQVRDHLPAVIQLINDIREDGAGVLAADVPSGLDCDTGRPSNATILADVTVTFMANKIGFTRPGAERYTGEVVEAHIGAPGDLIERVIEAG
jgi:NAD(P)H-hydrate epimerase